MATILLLGCFCFGSVFKIERSSSDEVFKNEDSNFESLKLCHIILITCLLPIILLSPVNSVSEYGDKSQF